MKTMSPEHADPTSILLERSPTTPDLPVVTCFVRAFAAWMLALVAPSAGCNAATPPGPQATESALPVPAPAKTATAATHVAAAPKRCTVDQLSVESTQGDTAMHKHSARFLWKNVSSSPCEVEGFPSVRPLGAGGKPLPEQLAVTLAKEGTYLTQPMPVRRIVLSPGDAAWFAVDFSLRLEKDEACVRIPKLEVAPPGAARGRVIAIDWEVCRHGIEVSPVAPGRPDG
jgi:hypothetical protein